MFRQICSEHGINLENHSEQDISSAFRVSDKWLNSIQIKMNVDKHHGTDPEDWIEANSILFKELGFNKLTKDVIYQIENEFQEARWKRNWESLKEDSYDTLETLSTRGYKIGICTRRHDNPAKFLEKVGIDRFLSVITWSGVTGYAKPSPYTLLEAAYQIGINPKLCAFVGNYVDSDVEAAIRCYMFPILLTWANPSEKEIAPDDTLVLENPSDLLEIFKNPEVPL